MTLTTKNKVIIVVVYSVALVGLGAYLVPTKIKTEIKTVEVEKKDDKTVVKKDTNTHKKTVTVVTQKPDGEKTTTITKTDDSTSTDDKHSIEQTSIDKTTDQTKEVTKTGGTLRLSLLGGAHIFGSSTSATNVLVYGASASKNLIGPMSCGLWGLSDGTVGASIGIDL